MSRDWRSAVERMVMCAERVVAYTAGVEYERFISDAMLYDATLRNLEIMGEAAKRIPAEVRDRLAHGYDALDDEVIWQAVHDGVPRVLSALRRELAETDRERGDA